MLFFLVYDDNNHNEYLDKLLASVEDYGKKFKIIRFNKNDINKEFIKKNKSILGFYRGGGYWLWKPYIINKLLKKIKDDDLIFYLDSKYYFLEDFTNLYLDYMKNNDLLVWKNKPNESINFMKNWCKMDVINKYNMYDKIFNENVEDCWAGALIIKKNQNSIKYMEEWLEMCTNFDDITDSPSKSKNCDLFIEHRHDQSLLSIIIYKYNLQLQFFENKYLQNVRNPF